MATRAGTDTASIARHALRAIAATLFPLACAGCGRPGAPVCPPCTRSLGAAPLVAPPAAVRAWWAAHAYEGAARQVIADVKYRGRHAAVDWLADAIVGVVPPLPASGIVVAHPPTTAAHRRSRGFDHAARLARAVGARLAVPTIDPLRRLDDLAQTGRSARERRAAPPRFAALAPAAAGGVVPVVLLVDDVATTGATLGAAATALRRAGWPEVLAATAARPRPPARR